MSIEHHRYETETSDGECVGLKDTKVYTIAGRYLSTERRIGRCSYAPTWILVSPFSAKSFQEACAQNLEFRHDLLARGYRIAEKGSRHRLAVAAGEGALGNGRADRIGIERKFFQPCGSKTQACSPRPIEHR